MVPKPNDDYKKIYVLFLNFFLQLHVHLNYFHDFFVMPISKSYTSRNISLSFDRLVLCKMKKTNWWAWELKSWLPPLHAMRFIIVTLTYHRHRNFSLYLLVSPRPMHTSWLIRRANVSLDLTAWHWAKRRTNHDYRSEANAGRWQTRSSEHRD